MSKLPSISGENGSRMGKAVLLAAIALAGGVPYQSARADDQTPGTITAANGTISHPGPPRSAPLTSIAIDSPVPPVDIQADHETIKPEAKTVTLDGDAVLTAGDELTLSAEHITLDGGLMRLDAYGTIVMRELDTTFTASSMRLDGEATEGILDDATIHRYPYYANARRIVLDQKRLNLEKAMFTTCPPDDKHPLFSVRADAINVDTVRQTIGIHNASFYVLGTRLLTIPHLQRHLPKHEENRTVTDSIRQTFGYNNYDKLYVVANDAFQLGQMPVSAGGTLSTKGVREAKVSASYTLVEPGPLPPSPPAASPIANALRSIRAIAQANEIPVPEHDPLRFHDFTSPSPVAGLFVRPQRGLIVSLDGTASYREQFFARRVDDLRVSRIPEATVTATTPLGKIRPLFPPGISPSGVREVLKQTEWLFSVDTQEGYYKETPTRANDSRTGFQANVQSRPFLIGPNLLLRPRVTFNHSNYGDSSDSYQYIRGSVAVMKLISDLTAVGFEYDIASQTGSSPFVWDTLDTPNELDLRGQYGNGVAIIGSVMQIDLAHHSVYTTQISLGPNLRCIIPRVIYDTRSRNIGFGADLPGITF